MSKHYNDIPDVAEVLVDLPDDLKQAGKKYFQLGDTVTWYVTSRDRKYWYTGEIVAVLPPGYDKLTNARNSKPCKAVLRELGLDPDAYAYSGDSMPARRVSDRETYVVAVDWGGEYMHRLYRPDPTMLRLVEKKSHAGEDDG